MTQSVVTFSTALGALTHMRTRPGWTVQQYHDHLNPAGIPCLCQVTREDNGLYATGYVPREAWEQVPDDNESLAFTVVLEGRRAVKSILALNFLVGSIAIAALTGGAATGLVAVGLKALSAASGLIGSYFSAQAANANQGVSSSPEVSPTYSLNAQGNRARLGEVIPKVYGRHLIFPDYASLPYTEFRENEQYLYQLFALTLGPCEVEEVRIGDTKLWDSTSGYSATFSDAVLTFYEPGQTVTAFPATVETSGEVGGIELSTDWSGPFVACSSGNTVTSIALDLVFPQGLFSVDTTSGAYSTVTVQVSSEARLIDDAGDPLGSWFALGTDTSTNGHPQPIRKTLNYTVADGRYEVRAKRLTPDDTSTNVGDTVQWTALRGFVPGAQTFAGVSTMTLAIRASNQLAGQSDQKINVILTSKLPAYDAELETWGTAAATQNPAWALADILRNTDYGAGVADSKIDLVELARLAAIYETRGDTCNIVMDTKQTIRDALMTVGATCRTKVIQVGGTHTFLRDEPQAMARIVYTPRSILRDSLSVEHLLNGDDTIDDVVVEYLDEATWKPNEVQCIIGESAGSEPARVKLPGVTSHAQAWREGMFLAAANRHRRKLVTLGSDIQAQLLLPGHRVALAHPLLPGSQHAVVTARSGVTVTLDRLMTWQEPQQHYILFKRRDGQEYGPIECSQGASANVVTLDATDLASVEGEQGALADQLNTSSLDEVPTTAILYTVATDYKVLSVRNRGRDSNVVSLILDDAAVYTADTGTPPTKTTSLGPGITPDRPVVSDLLLVIDPLATTSPAQVTASWPVATGAATYQLEVSFDLGSTWQRVYDGSGTNAQFTVFFGVVKARVRGIGQLFGPWYETTTNVAYNALHFLNGDLFGLLNGDYMTLVEAP